MQYYFNWQLDMNENPANLCLAQKLKNQKLIKNSLINTNNSVVTFDIWNTDFRGNGL